MLRKLSAIFCENEHGTGEVTFPNLRELPDFELHRLMIDPPTDAQLRRKAKAAGWVRHNGADYCPACKEAL